MTNLIMTCNRKRYLSNSTTISKIGRKFHNGKRIVKKSMENLVVTPKIKNSIEMDVIDSTESKVNSQNSYSSWQLSKDARQLRWYKSWKALRDGKRRNK